MRLKQLKLAGFKSFANPTTFHFKHTITAIVGPNGCGKSNVIDAVRWVLGESSAKQLRGGAMSDVIFAGSQDKAGKSLASVELVFEHTQADEHGRGGINHPLNLYHELSVRRQITKDGKSDYFINSTKVRRRDIVDIFLGTGLGSRSYAVIEQGMIGRIIDANALQLREFIEEASGVSRYQSRKEDTEKQLQTASDNLNRLSDMTLELSTQQKRLEKQAKTAQKAQEYQRKIDQISKQLISHEYNHLNNEKTQLSNHCQTLQQQLNKFSEQQQTLQSEHKNLIAQSHEQQILQQEQQNHYQRQWQSHHETQSLYNQQQTLLTEHQNKISLLNQEQQQLQTHIATLESNLAKNQTMIANLPNELKNIQIQLENSKQENQTLNLQRQEIANQISQLHKDKQECEKQQAIYENSLKNHQQQLNKLVQRQQQHAQKLAQLAEQQATLDDDDNEQQLASLVEKSQRLENQILDRQEQLEEQQELVESLKTQQQAYERQRQTWQTEQDTLHNLLNKQEQFLQKIKQNQKDNHHLPLLLENLRLSEQGKTFAKQLDELLSIFSKWTLIDKQQISQLTGQFASFFMENRTETTLHLPTNWVKLQILFEQPVLPILQHIWFNLEPIALDKIDDIVKNLNNDCLLLQTPEQEIWLISQHFCLNFNQLYQSDTTTELSHRFSHQLRIDTLQDLLDKQITPLENLNRRLQAELIGLQEWQAQDKNQRYELKSLTDKIQQLNHEKIRQTHQKNQWQQDKIRLDEEGKSLEQESQTLQKLLEHEQQQLDNIQQNLYNMKPILSEMIKQREHFDNQIALSLTNQKQLEATANELTIALTKGQLQQQHEQDNLEKLTQQVSQNRSQIVQLQNLAESLAKNLPNLAEQLQCIQASMSEFEENLQISNEQLALLENKKSQLQQKIDELQTLYLAEQQIFYSTETKLALCEQKIEQVLVKISEYQLDLATLSDSQILTTAQVVALQTEQSQLQQKLTQLGAVNYSAVAELTEVNDRLLPLNQEITDLTESIAMLRQAIGEIDAQTKQLFMAMLKQVNHDLNQLFSQIFGGGQAQLVLAEDSWQSGLELMAQPKGKKNSRLALLSGGEKTLTALSLIFAIFKQQPAPFCVLDEVDAPLDDANVERFTNLIKDLAKDVQFIFISHNKLAMQVADELKGITMPTAGISTLVSVDMKDVNKYLK